ncbi:hypothetical protein [Ectopseudomonas mendocina]|uniref:hypothetical protein n=1 Tax=Ectopseudomonas mendocina TaxID=300 RepID=UPI00163D8975|nr:hypothetical protein [Pseudomonas mendocina]
MKLAHYVFLALLVLPFVFPKLLWWLISAMLIATIVMLLIAGPLTVASWFVPRNPKR